MSETRTCASLSRSHASASFHQTWHAPYLPGEEGAILVLKLTQAGPTETGGWRSEDVGWVALPLEDLGEQHVQLHALPLPGSASEARNPRSSPLSAWVHCELLLGVTGSHAAFVREHTHLQLQRAGSFLAAMKSAGAGAAAGLARATSKMFNPMASPRRSTFTPSVLPDATRDVLQRAKPLDAYSLDAILRFEPAPSDKGADRGRLGELLRAAAAAAAQAEPDLALRGYATAFAVTRSAPLLLLAANMLFKLGALDEAARALEHLAAEPSLSAEQRSDLLAKQEQVAKARAAPKGAVGSTKILDDDDDAGAAGGKLQRRASMRHQLMDRKVQQLLAGSPAAGEPSAPKTPHPAAGYAPAAADADAEEEGGRKRTSTFVGQVHPARCCNNSRDAHLGTRTEPWRIMRALTLL